MSKVSIWSAAISVALVFATAPMVCKAQQRTATPIIRDQFADPLLTPKNAALIIIDYQPIAVNSVQTMDRQLLVDNIVRVAKTAKAYGLPIVVSTTGVKSVGNKPTIPELQEVLGDIQPIDRTTLNAWEDPEFVAAVEATGRRKLIMTGLWSEVCLTFPALDAMREGYEVYPVVDAVGGTSLEAHKAGLDRIFQAGGHPTTWVQLISELQRDTARQATLKPFMEILFDPRLPFVAAAQKAESADVRK
jgi:nicotinamidase-related amidase